MSALPEALPLAISAALYPPALIILLVLLAGEHPRQLVLAYYAGAALLTVGGGLIALAVVNGAGATTDSSSTASAWVYIALGVVLLGLATWAWRRRAVSNAAPEDEQAGQGRIAEWSHRATTSQKWAFALGLVMFLPSPLYLLAVKDIADSSSSTTSNVVAVLICALGVLLLVEIPLIGMFVRPDGVTAGIRRFHGWLKRNGWSIAAGVALIGGVYAIVTGISTLD